MPYICNNCGEQDPIDNGLLVTLDGQMVAYFCPSCSNVDAVKVVLRKKKDGLDFDAYQPLPK